MNKVRKLMAFGCLTDEHSYFITVTYKASQERSTGTASSVAADWRELLRRLSPIYPNLKWFKVMELTKKKIPHLHLLVNGLGKQQASCQGKMHPWKKAWLLEKDCNCLEHVWGREWHRVTGDSYIVAVRAIWEARGAVNYMAKYLQKTFDLREDMEARGWIRRYSCSRNWPRSMAHIKGEGRWFKSEAVRGHQSDVLLGKMPDSSDHPLLKKEGSELEMEVETWYSGRSNTTKMDNIRRFLDASN